MIPQKNPLIASGESVHANMLTTLWENPSPTSNFVAQDITLASDDYDFLLWIYGTASTNPKGSVIAPKGTGSILLSSGLTNSTHGVTNVQRTAVYVSDTKYSVSAGTLGRPSGAYSEDNTVCKPIAVYGFKKSLDITAIVSNVSTDATKCMLSDNVTNVDDAIKKRTLKSDTFSGTSDATGNIYILGAGANRCVVATKLSQSGYTSYPFIYHDGCTYIHLMTTNGTYSPNTAAAGTYYYYDT